MENKQIDILDILLILAKHKKLIIIPTIIFSIIAIAYSLLATPYWSATTTIMPIQEQSSSLPLGGGLLGLGSSLLDGIQTEGVNSIMIMKSRTFSKDVIEHFNLIEYLEIEHVDKLMIEELAIKTLKEKLVQFSLDPETGLIAISVETKDKYFSADIANYYVNILEEYNINNRMTKGKQKRIFVEERLKEVKIKIDSISCDINKFQKDNNTIDLLVQTQAVVELYSSIVAQKITADIEYEYSRKYLDANHPELIKLKNRKQIVEQKLTEFENSQNSKSIQYVLGLNDLPDIAYEYSKLLIDLDIQKKVYEYLYPQYEEAKIEEVKDLPSIETIDKAVPLGFRTKPKRARICIIVFILSILVSSAIVLFINLLSEDHKIKIKLLRNELFNFVSKK